MPPRPRSSFADTRSFIDWSSTSRRLPPRSRRLYDPGFTVNRQRLMRYLGSLESFSGQ